MADDCCQIVRRYLDAFWNSRWDDVTACLADDALYVDPLLPEPVRGQAAIRAVLAYCHEWGAYQGTIVSLFGSGRHVAAELQIRGSVKAAPEGMSEAVVGKEFAFVECDVFQFDRDARIVRQTIYADAMTL
jgi:steroid delta-isomerase-like uncharacterized protein